MTEPILATAAWKTNAELLAHAVVPLGYLRREWITLDPTHNTGKFWTLWRPQTLLRGDLDPAYSPDFPGGLDATRTGLLNDSVDVTVLDGPYRLNGTPDMPFDPSYGIDQKVPWQERIAIIERMITEAARISTQYVLVKAQAQVCSGKVRWQDRIFADHAESVGLELVDRFDMCPPHRKQPTHNSDGSERRQVHARRNNSTLLVFKA